MRVLLSTYGSRGDVEPMVGLAVQLRALCAEGCDATNALLARAAHDLAAEVRGVVQELGSVTKTEDALALVQKEFQNTKGARELDQAVAELNKLGFSAGS